MDNKKINRFLNISLIVVISIIAIWLIYVEGIDAIYVLAGGFIIIALAFSTSFLPFRMSHKVVQTQMLKQQKNVTDEKIKEIQANTVKNTPNLQN